MSATVHSLRLDTMALFYSQDADPKFGVRLCNRETLAAAIHATMFMGGALDDAQKAECAGYVDELLRTGSVDMEDGWLELRTSMPDAVSFLMEKVNDAVSEQRYEDQRRFDELKRREIAETKYAVLCEALIGAIDTKADSLRKIVADGGVAA